MFSQIIKSGIQSQKRSVSTESLPKLAVKNKFKSRGSAFNFKPQKVEPGVYHQPSPSIPSPLQKTPNAFLPASDIRKSSSSEYTAEDVSYMPPLSSVKEKKYHLTAQQIEEIRQLRNSDPYTYTRKALAKKFDCSEFFVSLVVDCPPDRLKDMAGRLDTIKSTWSVRKKEAKSDHEKRKQNWYRNA
ncbi:mitochondrial 54S ribosomal protein YmL20 [Saccharomycopsis crataegensis]|uniref:Mitochondrial 54S ribosomal protein YmL20 n=1 Tax=Saccharomycopsis crataegensis TaxID=43959 RepID=A0AAV5QEW0_9ASCO|nr:mitochondrial 54S ribosomal protein YmL20 [Saccharomycopsis crataegensis]